MTELSIINHPLIKHRLSILRNKETDFMEFREAVSDISSMLCYEATRDLPLESVEIRTPVSSTKTHRLCCEVTLVPILRAGLGMLSGALKYIPSAKVGHIGLYRDPATLEPVDYYRKMPNSIAESRVMILDPMLATGGSASAAIKYIKSYGCASLKLICIIAAPEGIERIRKDHPDVEIYTAALDEKLNEHGYIVPGLGDAGDRMFGTI